MAAVLGEHVERMQSSQRLVPALEERVKRAEAEVKDSFHQLTKVEAQNSELLLEAQEFRKQLAAADADAHLRQEKFEAEARRRRELEEEVEALRSEANRAADLQKQLKDVNDRVDRRTSRLKAVQKELRKAKKRIIQAEDRAMDIGYDFAVLRAHEVGLDHKKLLNPGRVDPVGRKDSEADDAPPPVSSGEEEPLSP